MNSMACCLRSLLAPLAVLTVLTSSPMAAVGLQTPAPQHPPVGLTQSKAEDPHEEMVRLFGRVERRQREIDELLGRAGEPPRVGKLDLAGLLEESETRSRESLQDIDRILQLAGHTHPGGGT